MSLEKLVEKAVRGKQRLIPNLKIVITVQHPTNQYGYLKVTQIWRTGVMRAIMVSTPAFLTCTNARGQVLISVGSLNFQALVCDFFWSLSGVCSGYSSFLPSFIDHLVGLVVKASASRADDPGFESCLLWDFSRVEPYQWLKIGTPVATLPGTCGTGWPGVSILWLDEMENLVCNFYLSVTARKIVWADPSLRYTSMLLGC